MAQLVDLGVNRCLQGASGRVRKPVRVVDLQHAEPRGQLDTLRFKAHAARRANEHGLLLWLESTAPLGQNEVEHRPIALTCDQ